MGAPFGRMEYESRLERIQRQLSVHGLDALLLSEMANFEYVSGFQARVMWSSYTRPLAVLVPADGMPALLVPDFVAQPAADASRWKVRTYERIDRPPLAELRGLIADAMGSTGRLGMELAGETRAGLPIALVERLAGALPGIDIVDGAALMMRVRMRKSEAEIERLRHACAANTLAFAAVFGRQLEGASEVDVARDLVAAALGAGRNWEGWTMPGWVAITSGQGSYHRFLGHPRPRTLQRGDMIWSDLGVTVDGYWSDFCRAAVVGGPTDQQRERQERILKATEAGVSRARPGARASDVAVAVGAALEGLGLPSFGFGRVGHGIGLTATELPHVARYDDTLLEEGMVITVEPASVMDDGLYCAEQVVAVADPPQVLSTAPGRLASV